MNNIFICFLIPICALTRDYSSKFFLFCYTIFIHSSTVSKRIEMFFNLIQIFPSTFHICLKLIKTFFSKCFENWFELMEKCVHNSQRQIFWKTIIIKKNSIISCSVCKCLRKVALVQC